MKTTSSIPLPDEVINERKVEIAKIINDLNIGDSGLITADAETIASYRTSFDHYLKLFNESFDIPKTFSIRKDKKRYRVWRTA